jgi:glucan-binding YG repeat protein
MILKGLLENKQFSEKSQPILSSIPVDVHEKRYKKAYETLEKELEEIKLKLILQSDTPGAFERGFNEGLKVAKQEQILNLTDSKIQPLLESFEKLDDKMKNEEADVLVVEQENQVQEEVQQENQVQEEEQQEEVQQENQVQEEEQQEEVQQENQVQEEEQQEEVQQEDLEGDVQEEEQQEEESPEFEEIELKGQTYYLNTETFKFYLPSEDGEIDVESPVGLMDKDTGKCKFFPTVK